MIARYSREEISQLWTDETRFQLWLEIETLALEAMVEQGIAPQSALESVRNKGGFNTERVLEIEREVKHDVIAFLTNVAEHVGEDARFLHFGMTSSDLLDTTFAVQLCRATDIILRETDSLLVAVKELAYKHKNTMCIGRSHGIHAEPTTFGLKVATWYDELVRARRRIKEARSEVAVGAISGPVGTYAHLGPAVEKYVCDKLGFEAAPVSTQIILRDRHATLFTAFALLATSLERIAIEVRHLQRTEVREAEEFFSKGQKGSSAMPHKRNPVLSENVSGLARLVRSWAQTSMENVLLWHERDISHSSAERVIAPDATIALDFMLVRVRSIVSGLVVYPENMQRNLEMTNGLVFSGTLLVALAAKGISREKAYSLVQGHALATWDELNTNVPLAERRDLEARIRADSEVTSLLSEQELDDAFSLDRHVAHVDHIFSRVFSE
jgi:adenylosuccinate lyase